ncbi:MAG: HAD family phosphatase [Patescibacteria group bacterium]|nr:HAD family phosphatase [Patescibacteria group bacterium]
MIKGIIYDLDDVIIDSYGLHVKATEMVLAEFGVKPGQQKISDKLEAKLLGKRVIEVMEILARHHKLKVDPRILHQRREEIFLKLAQAELELFPGVKESLRLFKAEGFKTAVASSGTKELINFVLGKFGLFHLFEEIVSAEDVKKGKPDPEVFKKATGKMGLKPEECVVLDDSTNGIIAAKKAGCKCIAVPSAQTPKQDLSKADRIVDSLGEITLSIIKQLDGQ